MPARHVAIFGLILVGASAVFAQNGSRPSRDPESSADKYKAILAAQQTAMDAYIKACRFAKNADDQKKVVAQFGRTPFPDHYAPKMLAIVRDHTKDAAAIDAAYWMLLHVPMDRETGQAIDILIKNRIEDEAMLNLCGPARSMFGEQLLRACIEKNPHRKVQAFARYNLAISLQSQQFMGAKIQVSDAKEAERLLQEIIDKYGDLKRSDGTPFVKQVETELFAIRHLAVGKKAPEIEGRDLDGNPLKLSAYRGKVVLLVFWSTWCAPCMADVPHERELAKRLEGKPFAIVGVNSDKDRELALRSSVKEEMPWRSFWDGSHGPIITRWNVQSWPELYLLDADGVIRYKGAYLRSRSDKGRSLESAVDTLLKEIQQKGP